MTVSPNTDRKIYPPLADCRVYAPIRPSKLIAGGHMLLAKTYDSFSPLGPWRGTRDAIPDPMHLRIQTRGNGEMRQDGNTRDMLWSIPKLIAHFSQITLMPGDIIESEIEGILANGVVDEPAA